MEVKINREIRNYSESVFFGLSMRQCIFSVLAIAVAVGLYFVLKPYLGTEWFLNRIRPAMFLLAALNRTQKRRRQITPAFGILFSVGRSYANNYTRLFSSSFGIYHLSRHDCRAVLMGMASQ